MQEGCNPFSYGKTEKKKKKKKRKKKKEIWFKKEKRFFCAASSPVMMSIQRFYRSEIGCCHSGNYRMKGSPEIAFCPISFFNGRVAGCRLRLVLLWPDSHIISLALNRNRIAMELDTSWIIINQMYNFKCMIFLHEHDMENYEPPTHEIWIDNDNI